MTSKGDKRLVQLSIDTDRDEGEDRGSIIATDHHPFWVPALKKWVKAADLKPGMWLRTSAGTYVQVEAIRKWTAVQRVHNMSVQNLHTYYVLADATPILVHNCPPSFVTKAIGELPVRSKGSKTNGRIFGPDGNEIGPAVSSGSGDVADAINKYLESSPLIANPPRGPHPSATHVETWYAWWLKNAGVKHAVVVINNQGGVCGAPFGCMKAVEAILPRGKTMEVWYPGATEAVPFVGLG
ncbi:DddA-like double-stranded DNA deaminase toxin [Nonomuraea sp. 3N208]|uniref:DddA-like double-stranded DNA deaminase toxin n=1 Tax=Nonomuraea sp. 3N208 TaxID=3457421 RepID=UPI003FCCEF85